MPRNTNFDPEQIVKNRFRSVSLDNPINAILFDLALERERKCSVDSCYNEDMRPSLPNMDDYLKMRRKVSLMPLEKIRDRIKLPSLPGMILRLNQALENKAGSNELAEIIKHDAKLTAAIMGLVNSPIFSLPNEVETLSRAITVLGTREISSLALGARIVSMFEDHAPQGLPIRTFWKHSISCGVFAHDIAKYCGRPEPEKYLVAGLLHDLGRLMLFSQYPDLAKVAFALQESKCIPLHKSEMNLFDVDHAMVGGVFLSGWNLPKSVVHSALYHHEPKFCIGRKVPEIVYVANQLSSALGMGCNTIFSLDTGEEIWASLNINEEGLHTIVENVEERLWSTFNSFFPDNEK